MLRSPSTRVATAVGQLGLGVAAIVGLPIALAMLFGWPLPATWPSWEAITSTPLRFVEPTVILNLFVCLAWISWAVLTIYTVLGVADSLRGRPERRHRVTPLAMLAGKITASALMLGALTRPVPVDALPSADPISLPIATALEPGPGPAPVGGEAQTARPSAGSVPVYVVQRGDTLWDIAAEQLGDPFRWPEIRDLNPDLLTNPSLIRSGWELTLPTDATKPMAPSEPMITVPPEPAPAELPQSDLELDAPSAGVAGLPPTTAAPDVTTTEASAPTMEESEHVDSVSLVAVGAGLTGATALATGLAVALQRRRRRSAPGPLPYFEPTDLERTVVAASDLPLVRWVGQELARLAELIAGQARPIVPVAVEFSEATGIEVLWDRATPDPVAGWTVDPSGWSWARNYDPTEPVPEPERPSALPALVTVGQRDGKQLLVNLEALGGLTVTGDPAAAENLLRSMLVELTTGDEIGHARVLLTIPALVPSESAGVSNVSEDRAIADLSALTAEVDDLLARSGCATTFAYRTLTTPVLPLDVTVVAGSATSQSLVDVARDLDAHGGVVVVLTGDHDGLPNRIHVAVDGTAVLEPLGIRFTPAALPVETHRDLVGLPDQPMAAPAEDDPAGFVRPWWLEPDGSDDLDVDGNTIPPEVIQGACAFEDLEVAAPATDAAEPEPEAAPRMTVKVLGVPRLVDGPALTRRELAVVALVACSGRPITHEQVQDAVWGSSPISTKSVFNLIGSVRSTLGMLDGQPVLSAASRPDNTIGLHPGVSTDLDLLRSWLESARRSSSNQAMDLLVRALELVEGPPFNAVGYEWAITEQLVSEAEHLVEQAAAMCAELALDAGDVERARWALVQGLRAIPGDEALYRLRMRVEAVSGNPAGVRRAFLELEAHLDEFGLVPSESTQSLLRELSSSGAAQIRGRTTHS